MANQNDPNVKIPRIEEYKRGLLNTLQYPANLGSQDEKRYTVFRIFEYDKNGLNRVELQVFQGEILLPIPSELSNGDALQYEEFSSPVLGSGIEAGSSDTFGGMVKGVTGTTIAVGSATLKSFNAGEALTNQTANQSGASVNPRNTNIFKTPSAREHKFTFKMVAKSALESESIRKIVNKFRYHAYPDTGLGESLYLAPDLFNIRFKLNDNSLDDRDTYLFHPLPSALVGMQVSYNGQSAPVFYKGTGAPVEVILTLIFKEMEMDNKEKLIERYSN